MPVKPILSSGGSNQFIICVRGGPGKGCPLNRERATQFDVDAAISIMQAFFLNALFFVLDLGYKHFRPEVMFGSF